MEYRIHPRTKDKISVIGIGTGPIYEAPEQEAVETLSYACEHGINYVDFATAGAETFRYAGLAFASVRRELLYQVHFGANYETGEYGWTTDLDKVKGQIDWQLSQLNTDYIDFGVIHCLDSAGDWEQYQENGVLDYLLEMKKSGVVRHIGLSTHTPELAGRLRVLRRISPVPVAAGFGIDGPESAAAVARYADAVVVGSAAVRLPLARLGAFVASLRRALSSASGAAD